MMTDTPSIGLGELLRHLTELLDRDAERAYATLVNGVDYRARYTPIMRAFRGRPLSITELQQRIRITQGAISQTVKLMVADGLLYRIDSEDRRMRKVALTGKGEALRQSLSKEWDIHLDAIAELEAEIGVSLRRNLVQAIAGLEREGFEQRIEKARKRLAEGSGIGAG